MKIYKRISKKKRTVILLDKGKLLFMAKKDAEDKELRLSFMHFPKIKNDLYVDMFSVDHESGLYESFDSIFSSSRSNQVCFDTDGAHLTLSRTPDAYHLNFMNEFYQGARSIKTRLVDDSLENKMLNDLFDYLVGDSKRIVTDANKKDNSVTLPKEKPHGKKKKLQ